MISIRVRYQGIFTTKIKKRDTVLVTRMPCRDEYLCIDDVVYHVDSVIHEALSPESLCTYAGREALRNAGLVTLSPT